MLYADLITASNFTLFQNPRKYSLTRHDAVASLVIDGAFIVALLADLGDFNHSGLAQSNPGSQRQRFPVNSGRGYVFREITKGYIKTL
jgi:hypothetical protein